MSMLVLLRHAMIKQLSLYLENRLTSIFTFSIRYLMTSSLSFAPHAIIKQSCPILLTHTYAKQLFPYLSTCIVSIPTFSMRYLIIFKSLFFFHLHAIIKQFIPRLLL